MHNDDMMCFTSCAVVRESKNSLTVDATHCPLTLAQPMPVAAPADSHLHNSTFPKHLRGQNSGTAHDQCLGRAHCKLDRLVSNNPS